MLIPLSAVTTEPVSLPEAKGQIGVIHDLDDARITAIIPAAREAVELSTGRALAAAQYKWTPVESRTRIYRLPLYPVETIDSVATWGDGEAVGVDAADFTHDADRGLLALSVSGAPAVTFTTAQPAVLPAGLRSLMLLLIADLYENTEASAERALQENPVLNRLLYLHRVNLGS